MNNKARKDADMWVEELKWEIHYDYMEEIDDMEGE